MGIIIHNLADYVEPAPLSIVARPNFFQMFGYFEEEPTDYVRTVRFKQEDFTDESEAATIVVKLPDGSSFNLRPITDITELSGTDFYVDESPARTAENIKNALMSISYIADNFDVNIFSTFVGVTVGMQSVIHIKGKGRGIAYNLRWEDEDGNEDQPETYWQLTGGEPSHNYDELTQEKETALIEIDVYTGTTVKLGLDDFPDTEAKIGKLVTTLKKNYIANGTVWFDMNALFAKSTKYKAPVINLNGALAYWTDAGTLIKYRFDARLRDSKGVYTIFRSGVRFALNGFSEVYEGDQNNMYAQYVYNGAQVVKQLTNQPRITYVPGQPVFLNFLYGDPLRVVPEYANQNLDIRAQAYTQSGAYITTYDLDLGGGLYPELDVHTVAIDLPYVIRTIEDEYGQLIGIIKLCIIKNGIQITQYKEYELRPSNRAVTYSPLHDENSFVFLNALGGWDSFNFDAANKKEMRPGIETFNRTITPNTTPSLAQSLETVYTNDAEKTITIEGAPIKKDVCDWLEEMVKSKAIYHKGKYILVQDFTLTDNPDNASMPIPIIKFKYSDAWQL